MGSLKSLCGTFCKSSVETIALNCLVFFDKIAFCLRILATDRQTDRQTNRRTEPMRKRALADASGALIKVDSVI